MRSVLTIADSDTSGRAGIQADLKTIASLACYGTSVITAITSQSADGEAIHHIPHDAVANQINSVLDHTVPNAVKVGLLYDVDCVRTVAQTLRSKGANLPIVCDPMCVSTSGQTLLDSQAIQVLIDELFPLSKVITPNVIEAELLLSSRGTPSKVSGLAGMVTAAKNLNQSGSPAVLLRGGNSAFVMEDVAKLSKDHPEVEVISLNLPTNNMEILRAHAGVSDGRLAADVLCDAGHLTLFVRPYVDSVSTHGTGNTLSAALASQLARGSNLKEGVKHAVAYTNLAASSAGTMDHQHETINHFHASVQRMVPQATPNNRYPYTQQLIQSNADEWKAYVEHDFIKLLGLGTLNVKSFKYFIIQDYKYLNYYSRAHALLAAKSTSFKDIKHATQNIMNVMTEIETHKAFCKSFGITEAELENTPEAVSTTAYGAYLIDIGTQGDTKTLLMALLACLLGYGEIGLWLKKEASLPDSWVVTDGNPYKQWMDDYSGEMYQTAVKVGLELIESQAAADPPSPSRLAEWEEVWKNCTRFEKGFWDAAMAAA